MVIFAAKSMYSYIFIIKFKDDILYIAMIIIFMIVIVHIIF